MDIWTQVVLDKDLAHSYKVYKPTGIYNYLEVVEETMAHINGFKDKINDLRKEYYQAHAIKQEEQAYLKSPMGAFVWYQRIKNSQADRDLDGGGQYMISHRKDALNLVQIREKLQTQGLPASDYLWLLGQLAILDTPHILLPHRTQALWTDIRFDNMILAQIKKMELNDFKVLIFYLTMIQNGIFFLSPFLSGKRTDVNWKLDGTIAFSMLYCEAFNQDSVIIGAIMPERKPICNDSGELERFEYGQYVLLTQFCSREPREFQKTRAYYNLHREKIQEAHDEDRYECFLYWRTTQTTMRQQNRELYRVVQNKYLFSGDFQSILIKPFTFYDWMFQPVGIDKYDFDPEKRRWYLSKRHVQVTAVAQKQVETVNPSWIQEKILTQLDSQDQSERLSDILAMMPTLQIKLNATQQRIVQSSTNLLCLGRSGTGKTTTSILRLFAQEIMFIILQKINIQKETLRIQAKKEEWKAKDAEETETPQEEKKQPKIKARITSSDMDIHTGLKMVFMTASPVLTNEVKRFYKNLKLTLKAHLYQKEQVRAEIKKRKELALSQGQEFTEVDHKETLQSEEQQKLAQNILTEIQNQEKKELLDFIQKEEKDLIEEAEMANEMNLPNAFDDLEPKHFPLFVTVQKLFYMMDACLPHSFFSRDQNNNINGMDSNLGWHNEKKGVLMINQYYKQTLNYDEEIAKFGKSLLKLDQEAGSGQLDNNFQNDLNFEIGDIYGQDHDATEDTQKQNINSHQRGAYFRYQGTYFSQEVNYETFEEKFWTQIARNKSYRQLTPTLVWTEIYSVIKGSKASTKFYMGVLPADAYLKHGSSFLTLQEKKLIYYIYLEYEHWKHRTSGFDFMDLVNHVQKHIYFGWRLRRMKMDYLMVDEVQDLTPKTLSLLLDLTSHRVFFAGDTAQTIAKGVSARFLDLKDIFSQLRRDVPKIVQLKTNYRSHSKILNLANSVVGLLELLFPRTIDRLVKERSKTTGMRPLVIMPLENRQLKDLMFGAKISGQNQGQQLQGSPQFGCNQVLIVRDQEAKALVPEIFSNMLCLTVYEAKGLEFDDVILFNFFHLGGVAKSQWKLLNDIIFEEQIRIKKGKKEFFDFESLNAENQVQPELDQQVETNQKAVKTYSEKVPRLTRVRAEVYRQFQLLCIELKFLYVAITRPKKRLIIYDQDQNTMKPLLRYWEQLDLVDVLTRSMLEQPEKLSPHIQQLFQNGAISTETNTEEEWRIQGIKFFKKKFYDGAIKCFNQSNDQDLVKRCKAYQQAEQGTAIMAEANSAVFRAQKVQALSKLEKKNLFKEAKSLRRKSFDHFKNAGTFFQQIEMYKNAASCFYTAQAYEEAAIIFEQIGQYGQAGECYMNVGHLGKAAHLFEKARLIIRSIECHEAAEQWEQLLHCLHRNKTQFKAQERESLVNKYVPIALNNLYKLYTSDDPEDQLDEENRGKMQEMKIKMKYQKNVKVVREEDEDMYDSDDDQTADNEVDQVNNDQNEDNNSQAAEEEQKENEDGGSVKTIESGNTQGDQQDDGDEDEEVELIPDDEDEPDLLEEVFQLKRQQQEQKAKEESTKMKREQTNPNNESSYEIINTTKEKIDNENANAPDFVDNFEHLSQYDPDDEFLRSSRSVSMIDLILSRQSISQTSDFSIINGTKSKQDNSVFSVATSNKGASAIAYIQNDRDIYKEDVITQKIIYYISLFSDEVSDHLRQLRSKNQLLSDAEKLKDIKAELDEDFIIDLDDISNDFVNLILDALEYYELFRLSLMICNRYHMSDRLGRYIISVCSKYSNLNAHRFNAEKTVAYGRNEAWKIRQRNASILAHEAIHNVFALIEPRFLSLKTAGERLTKENSLGMETYRMILDLGFWKKLVYIVSQDKGLDLCYKFFNIEHFEILRDNMNDKANEQLSQKVQNAYKKLFVKDFELKKTNMLLYNQCPSHYSSKVDVFKKLSEEYKADTNQQNSIVQFYLHLVQWLYQPPKTVKETKKSTQEDLRVQQQRIDEERATLTYEILEMLYDEVFAKLKTDTFNSHALIFEFATLHQTEFYGRFYQTIRSSFDVETIENLTKVYLNTIKHLNTIKEAKSNTNESKEILEALFTTFLISEIDDDVLSEGLESDQDTAASINRDDIFKSYRATHVIMHSSSPLLKDIISIQDNIRNVQINDYLTTLTQTMKYQYFNPEVLKCQIAAQYSKYVNSIDTKYAFWCGQKELAFVLDMDSEFLMVPRNWIIKLLSSRLLQLSIQLNNEAKIMIKAIQSDACYNNSSETNEIYTAGKEIQLDAQLQNSIKTTSATHGGLATSLTLLNEQNYAKAKSSEQYNSFIERRWLKAQFNTLSFSQFNDQFGNLTKAPFENINRALYMKFDMGLLYQHSQLKGYNEILEKGLSTFEEVFKINRKTVQLLDQEETIETTLQKCRLKKLFDALTYFLAIEKYEYLAELIRSKLKYIPKVSPSKNYSLNSTSIEYLLRKFMIALDIHVLLKNGSYAEASKSTLQLLKAFNKYLSNADKLKLASQAFYLVLIVKSHATYMPDNFLYLLDTNQELNSYYRYNRQLYENSIKDNSPKKLKGNAKKQEESKAKADTKPKVVYEDLGEERQIINVSLEGKHIESWVDDNLYVECLASVIKILSELNKDDQASAYLICYKTIYNIMMTASLNLQKNEDQIFNIISEGYLQIAEGPFEDYFYKLGLQDIDYSTPKGIEKLKKEFYETADPYKYEFFAGSHKYGGMQVGYVNATNAQTPDSDQQLATLLNKASIQEQKTFAQHLILSARLKKLFKAKKQRLDTQFKKASYEFKLYANKFDLYDLVSTKQIQGQKMLDLVKLAYLKEQQLKQMIVSKYATNSLDIHFLLTLASKIEEIGATFREYLKNFIEEKGQILNEFEDLDSNKSDLERKYGIYSEKLRMIEVEVSVWMSNKAEPNLIDVEQRIQRFKIKWQSINLFDRNEQLKVLRKQKELINKGN